MPPGGPAGVGRPRGGTDAALDARKAGEAGAGGGVSEAGGFRGPSEDSRRAESLLAGNVVWTPVCAVGEGVGACKQPPLLPSCQARLLPPQPPSSLGQVGFRVSVSLEFLKINPIGQGETMCRCLFQKDLSVQQQKHTKCGCW